MAERTKAGTDFRHMLPCSIAELLRLLGRKSYANLYIYVAGWKPCPPNVCLAIEKALDGAIRCEQMNPSAFDRPHTTPPSGKAA
jgi:DNA-binding transcriptional regulator YdaS (Cro superfamily)